MDIFESRKQYKIFNAMKSETVWFIVVVVALIIAEERSKNDAVHKLSDLCVAPDFYDVLLLRSRRIPCLLRDRISSRDNTKDQIQDIPPQDDLNGETELDKTQDFQPELTIPDEKSEGQDLNGQQRDDAEKIALEEVVIKKERLKEVVSKHPAEYPTEPKSPEVISQATDSTVNKPVIEDTSGSATDQGLQPPNVDEQEVEEVPVEAPKKATDDMPSFDEWKAQRLKEEEEKERNKQQESLLQQPSNDKQMKTKATPNRVNYASASCGAKIVGSNNEAQNSASILSENKDKYVIQPCKAKKWLAIELCEPIQVNLIELGNLEFFSSQPESFVMYISDRFPTKEWTSLGTFHARDVRAIQSFTVTDDTYAKYVKIEMLSHFGAEHYCPLTVIRVFGTTVHEEDGEETEEVFVVEDESLQVADDKKPASLLENAIDTVQSMIKDVLSTKDEPESKMEEIAEMKTKNVSNDTQPCPPDVTTVDSNVADSNSGEPHVGKPSNLPKPPDANILPSTKAPHVIIPPIVRLVEVPITSMQDQLNVCNFCDDRPPVVCRMDRITTCGYFRWMVYAYPTCCLEYFLDSRTLVNNAKPQETLDLHETPVVDAPIVAQEKKTKTTSIEDGLKPTSVTLEPSVGTVRASKTVAHTDTEKIAATPSEVIDSSTHKVTVLPEAGKIPASKPIASSIQPTSTIKAVSKTQEVVLEASQKAPASVPKKQTEGLTQQEHQGTVTEVEKSTEVVVEEVVKTEEAVKATAVNSHHVSCEAKEAISGEGNIDGCQMGPDIAKIRPSSTEQLPTATVIATPKSNTEVPQDPTPTPPQEVKDSDVGSSSKSDNVKGAQHIYAEESVPDLEDIEPPAQESDEEVQITKKPQLKETTFMKLRNRMKELELNLNLSSRYLEELSQRYKRQMEEMYTSLNRTIVVLSDTSRAAEERDHRQQEEIGELKETVHRLNGSLEELTGRMEGLNQQVLERHLFLMVAEVLVFVFLLGWMLRHHAQTEPFKDPPVPTPSTPAPTKLTATKIDTLKPKPGTHTLPAKPHRNSKPPDRKNKMAAAAAQSVSFDEDMKRRRKTPPRRRRNSSDGTPARIREKSELIVTERRSLDDLALTESYDNLEIVQTNLSLFLPETNSSADLETHRNNKKKKKTKHKALSTSSDHLAPRNASKLHRGSVDVTETHRNPKPRRNLSEDFSQRNGFLNGYHDENDENHIMPFSHFPEKISNESQSKKSKLNSHLSWDFVRKSSKQSDNGSASSSSSSVKSFRKK